MSKPGSGRGVALVLFASVIWGAQIPLSKWLFTYLDPFSVTAFRYTIPTLFLLGTLYYKESASAFNLRSDQSAPWRTALIGLSGMCISPTLVFGGLLFTRPEVAAIIIASQPTLAALALWVLRGKRPAMSTLLCVALAFFGVIMVVTRLDTNAMPKGKELLGDIMILGGAIAWVSYIIACERFKGWSTLRVTTLTMLPGAVGNLSVAALAAWFGIAHYPTSQGWLEALPGLLFLSFFGVLASMMAWSAGVRRIGPMNAVLFINLIPVVAFSVGFVRGKQFHAIELLGASLVIIALVANNLIQRRKSH